MRIIFRDENYFPPKLILVFQIIYLKYEHHKEDIHKNEKCAIIKIIIDFLKERS